MGVQVLFSNWRPVESSSVRWLRARQLEHDLASTPTYRKRAAWRMALIYKSVGLRYRATDMAAARSALEIAVRWSKRAEALS